MKFLVGGFKHLSFVKDECAVVVDQVIDWCLMSQSSAGPVSMGWQLTPGFSLTAGRATCAAALPRGRACFIGVPETSETDNRPSEDFFFNVDFIKVWFVVELLVFVGSLYPLFGWLLDISLAMSPLGMSQNQCYKRSGTKHELINSFGV